MRIPKFKQILIIPILFLSLLLPAQTTNFLKTFTPTPAFASIPGNVMINMWPQGVSVLNSSAFILGGTYNGFSNTINDTLVDDSYLIKNQTDGLTKWFRRYHLGKRRLALYDVGVNYNSDIIGVGRADALNSSENPDGVLLTTDSNGWLKSVRIYPKQSISKITVLKNNKIAILSSDSNSYNKLVLLDKNSGLLWSKRIYHTNINTVSFRIFEVIEGKDNSLLLVGYKFINMTNPAYVWYPYVLLCDSNGNKINDFTLPIGATQFLSASNNFDNGFYIVGSGTSPTNTNDLFGHMIKVDNLLQINWYNLYQCNYTHVEFTDLIVQSRNNISLLTEPEPSSSWSRRAGLTFMDSSGVIRKSYVYNPINTDQYPDRMLPIQNGKFIFTMYSNSGRLFGVTDTLQSSFCNMDTLQWTVINPSVTPLYNHVSLVNSPFTYLKDTAFVYTAKDVELLYVCSNGPTGPLDTINYPPPPPNLTTVKKTLNNENTEGRFSIQPNPATTFLTITTNWFSKSPLELSVINSEGKSMLNQELFNYSFPFKISLTNFPSGLYMLSIKTMNNFLYKDKFIVIRE